MTTQNFDDLGRRTNIRHADASNTTLGEYGYSFDAGDRITSETINGVTRSFGYDDINQLTSDGGKSLSYDKSGNRTMSGYTVGAGNRLLSDGTWNYTYNDEGQITSKASASETWNYTYDHAGQMTQASQVGGATVHYSFDAFGNRLQRDVTSGSTTTTERFAYDGWDTAKPGAIGSENFDVYADLDGNSNVTMRRLFGPGFDEPVARQSASGVVAWYGTDQLGSVRQVFDNSGTVTGTRSYSGFGEIISEAGAGLDRYAYTAREWDAGIGLQHSRARMYDPANGRWTSEDPMGFGAGDTNLSRYVGNGATLATDPSGMIHCPPAGSSSGPSGPTTPGMPTPTPNRSLVSIEATADGPMSPTPSTPPSEPGLLSRIWGGAKRLAGALYEISTPGLIELGHDIAMNVIRGNQLDNEVARRQGKEGPSLLESATNEAKAMGQAAGQGLITGGKANINALSDTVVSTATLGFYTDGTLFTPTQDDLDSGYDISYGSARVGYEVLGVAVTLGGSVTTKATSVIGRVANGARTGLTVVGRADAAVSVGRGVYDISQNGLTLGNVAQTGLGVLGLKGSAGRLADTRLNTGLSHLIHGQMGNSIFHKPLAAVGNFLGFKVCFAAGTPIRTPEGWKAIEELAIGDLVLSRDEHNCDGAVEPKAVEEVFVREGLLWELRVGGRVIKTTAEHPFFVLNKGWTAANLLQVGDYRQSADSEKGWINCNLRTQFHRLIERAGLTPWPRLFHNLRSSRETDLLEEFPAHVVAAWLGHDVTVAMKHYAQVTGEHFERASGQDQSGAESDAQPTQNPTQQIPAANGKENK